jgi:hypothetical protein
MQVVPNFFAGDQEITRCLQICEAFPLPSETILRSFAAKGCLGSAQHRKAPIDHKDPLDSRSTFCQVFFRHDHTPLEFLFWFCALLFTRNHSETEKSRSQYGVLIISLQGQAVPALRAPWAAAQKPPTSLHSSTHAHLKLRSYRVQPAVWIGGLTPHWQIHPSQWPTNLFFSFFAYYPALL